MKVQVLNNDGTVVWVFDAEERTDSSGQDWQEEQNVELMAGITSVLFAAYNQADIRPPGWEWPFNPTAKEMCATSGGFLATAKQVSRAGIPGAAPIHCLCGCQRRNNKGGQ